jgi:CheY-like chemotaxis protein
MLQVRLLEGIRILIVEDTGDTAMGLSLGFRRAGALAIETRSSVAQAQKRLAQEPAPDVVLLDNQLEGDETGIELALWMREQPTLNNTLRISYSAAEKEMLLAQCPDHQVFHVMLTKPLSLVEMIEQIAELVWQHQRMTRN